jgi:hypothetical protein
MRFMDAARVHVVEGKRFPGSSIFTEWKSKL